MKNVKFNHITNSLKHFFSDRFKVGKSKFSQFISGTGKLSSDEISGGLIFYGKGKCSICHSGPHFSDFDFHTILFPHAGFGKNGFGVDYGRFNVTFNAHDLHKFRTPPLHNVAKTSPYGHAGSLGSLRDAIIVHYDPFAVIEFSELDSTERRQIFDRARKIGIDTPIPTSLDEKEIQSLILFLKTLSF